MRCWSFDICVPLSATIMPQFDTKHIDVNGRQNSQELLVWKKKKTCSLVGSQKLNDKGGKQLNNKINKMTSKDWGMSQHI